jgi:hypothetical protein
VRRRILSAEFLQWFGLGGAALAWAGQLVVGFGVTVADCSAAGAGWGLDLRTWEAVLMGIAAGFVLLAEVAAITVFRETRELEYDGPPPDSRRHFFAIAAIVGNFLFLVAVLLSGTAALFHDTCRQA